MKKQKNKSRLTIFNQVKKEKRQETLFSTKQTKRQERFKLRKKNNVNKQIKQQHKLHCLQSSKKKTARQIHGTHTNIPLYV